ARDAFGVTDRQLLRDLAAEGMTGDARLRDAERVEQGRRVLREIPRGEASRRPRPPRSAVVREDQAVPLRERRGDRRPERRIASEAREEQERLSLAQGLVVELDSLDRDRRNDRLRPETKAEPPPGRLRWNLVKISRRS